MDIQPTETVQSGEGPADATSRPDGTHNPPAPHITVQNPQDAKKEQPADTENGKQNDADKNAKPDVGRPRSTRTSIIAAVITGVILVCNIIGLAFVYNSLQIAKQSADATTEAVRLTKEGKTTANETATALQKTAEANEKTANASTEAVEWYKKGNATAVETAKTLKQSAESNALTAEAQRQAIEWYRKAYQIAERAANATADAVAKSQQHHETQMRAFLSIADTKLEKSQPPRANQTSQFLVATISIKNTGLSPAHHVCTTHNIICESPDYQGPFPDGDMGNATAPPPPGGLAPPPPGGFTALQMDPKGPELSIGPGSPLQRQMKFPMNSASWAMWTNGKAIAWVYGHICYTDAFGHDHHTNFRFKQGNDLKTGAMILVLSDDGNDSD